MKVRPFSIIYSILLTFLIGSSSAFAEDEDKLQFSGFARIVAGYLDDKNAEYLDYDNSISIDKESLIGLQADYQIIDSLALTGQVIGHAGNQRDSGIEWLYLTYTPSDSLSFKLGRQRVPILNYSDVIDVGYAYPWATLPQQLYTRYFFSTFDGLMVNYEFTEKEFVFNIEAYWGHFEDKVVIDNRDIDAEVSNFSGLIGRLNYNNWSFRASYHQGDADVPLDELNQFGEQLGQLGFSQSAESLKTAGEIRVYQLSANYENLKYFVRSEFNYLEADFIVVPETTGYFISTGYNYFPFTTYLSYSKSKTEYAQAANDIPIGVNPQLDGLAFGYQAVFKQLPIDSSEAFTIGTRWDLQAGLALKGEISLLKGEEPDRAHFSINDPNFDRQALLYLLALEWVF